MNFYSDMEIFYHGSDQIKLDPFPEIWYLALLGWNVSYLIALSTGQKMKCPNFHVKCNQHNYETYIIFLL